MNFAKRLRGRRVFPSGAISIVSMTSLKSGRPGVKMFKTPGSQALRVKEFL